MCFVNCHLAAHLEAVNRRNADFNHIFRLMVFSRGQNLSNAAAGMVPYLFLSCSLGFSTYLFWLLYSSGLPWALSLAAGVSTSAYTTKSNTVCSYHITITYTLKFYPCFTMSVLSLCCLLLQFCTEHMFLCFPDSKHRR